MKARTAKPAPRAPRTTAKAPRASASLIAYLRERVEDAVGGLPGVTRKKMLVSIGWAVKGNVFTLVNRDARIVVRLLDADAQAELLAIEGAEGWKIGTRSPMKAWLLLPESRHDDQDFVASWLVRAFELTRSAPAKPSPRAKTKRK